MATTQRTVELNTADGHTLAADLTVPPEPLGTIVVCHPHPRYGGDRFHPVVEAIFVQGAEHGFAALRFDFRAAHGHGIAERHDVVAAIDTAVSIADGPIVVAGYSFGAAVALTTVDDRIDALVAVAPPLAMFDVEPPQVPTLVIAARHDQITDIDIVRTQVASWPAHHLEILPSADHFLVGHASVVAQLVTSWLDERTG